MRVIADTGAAQSQVLQARENVDRLPENPRFSRGIP